MLQSQLPPSLCSKYHALWILASILPPHCFNLKLIAFVQMWTCLFSSSPAICSTLTLSGQLHNDSSNFSFWLWFWGCSFKIKRLHQVLKGSVPSWAYHLFRAYLYLASSSLHVFRLYPPRLLVCVYVQGHLLLFVYINMSFYFFLGLGLYLGVLFVV